MPPGQSPGARPALSVIVVNHHSEGVLGDCLEALAAGDFTHGFEVVIVDNPAVEGTAAFPIPAGLLVRRVAAPKRLGFAAACNLGAKAAQGRFLLFLNPDVRLDRSAMSRLMAILVDRPHVGAAVGRLTGPDGRFQPSCRRYPTTARLTLSRGSILGRVAKPKTGPYTLPDYPLPTEVEAAAAAMMMLRRDVFDRVGGFDPAFFMYLEDTDLCYRLREGGYATMYVPDAGGVHLWGHSTARYRFRRLLWHHRSVWRYFSKHETAQGSRLLLAPALAANCLLSLAVELCTLRR